MKFTFTFATACLFTATIATDDNILGKYQEMEKDISDLREDVDKIEAYLGEGYNYGGDSLDGDIVESCSLAIEHSKDDLADFTLKHMAHTMFERVVGREQLAVEMYENVPAIAFDNHECFGSAFVFQIPEGSVAIS